MPDEPANWFYGLMAERAAEFTPHPYQIPFLQREIECFGQPVLDLLVSFFQMLDEAAVPCYWSRGLSRWRAFGHGAGRRVGAMCPCEVPQLVLM